MRGFTRGTNARYSYLFGYYHGLSSSNTRLLTTCTSSCCPFLGGRLTFRVDPQPQVPNQTLQSFGVV